MTDLTLYKGEGTRLALKGAKNMAAAMRESAQTGVAGGELPDGGVYIAFSGKNGTYSIGQDKEDADPEEFWLVNIFEFQDGWMCWKGAQPVAKRFASIFGDPVETPDFTEHSPFKQGEGWAPAKAMMLRSVDQGRQGYFSTSTKSAVKEFAKLNKEVANRLEDGRPAWPIIQLHKDKFVAQGNTNWKPILFVAGWLAMQQVQKLAAMESNEEALAALEGLVAEADKMEADGVLDSTMSDGSEAPELDDEPEQDDGIEDAELADEAAEAAAAAAAAAEEAARKAAAQKSGGLRRTLRKSA